MKGVGPKTMIGVEGFIKNLASGSRVVVANDRERFEKFSKLNTNVRSFHVTNDMGAPIEYLMVELFGKEIEKRPKFHMQFDVIYCGEGTSENLFYQLREYAHPGGFLVYEGKEGFFLPGSPLNVHIAKLKEGDKKFLWREISRIPEGGIYVEVGSYKGGSAVLAALANPKARIYCVDIWQREDNKDVYAPFDEWKRHTQYFPNIRAVKVELDALRLGPDKIAAEEGIPLDELVIDLLFLDGDHTFEGVLADLLIYEKYAKRVCGHDFHLGNDVTRAVYTYYSTGWKKKANRACNILSSISLLKYLLKLPPRPIFDKIVLQPASVGYMSYREDDSSIWFNLERTSI